VEDNNGTNLYPEPPDYFHGDLIIRNNKVRYVDGTPPADGSATLIQTTGAKSAMVKDNVLDTVATQPLQASRCGSITCFNNRTPGGVLLQGWNADRSRKVDELETDAEDALVLSLLED